jgi:hypothetical protein
MDRPRSTKAEWKGEPMTARLAWIALISLITSAACLVLASWISGTSVLGGLDRPWAMGQSCWPAPLARLFGANEPTRDAVTAKLNWDGDDMIDVKLSAKVFYQPGLLPEATVTGDPDFIRHVRLQGGALRSDANFFNCGPSGQIVVRLSGPPVTSWKVTGSSQLNLSDLNQDRLDVKLTGSGRARASGNVQRVSLDITGSAKADFGKLVTQRASARITGSGDADLAARDEAELRITGSGSVTLHGQPKQVQSHVSGSGKIRNVP